MRVTTRKEENKTRLSLDLTAKCANFFPKKKLNAPTHGQLYSAPWQSWRTLGDKGVDTHYYGA